MFALKKKFTQKVIRNQASNSHHYTKANDLLSVICKYGGLFRLSTFKDGDKWCRQVTPLSIYHVHEKSIGVIRKSSACTKALDNFLP